MHRWLDTWAHGDPLEPLHIVQPRVSDGAATEYGVWGLCPHPCRPETLRAEILTVFPSPRSFGRYSVAPSPSLPLTHGRTHGRTDGRGTHGAAAPSGARPPARPRARPSGRREGGMPTTTGIPPKRAMCHVPTLTLVYRWCTIRVTPDAKGG